MHREKLLYSVEGKYSEKKIGAVYVPIDRADELAHELCIKC